MVCDSSIIHSTQSSCNFSATPIPAAHAHIMIHSCVFIIFIVGQKN